jgi:hypothetical protein
LTSTTGLRLVRRLLEDVHARLLRAGLDEVHRAIEHALGGGLLALVIRALMNFETVWLS